MDKSTTWRLRRVNGGHVYPAVCTICQRTFPRGELRYVTVNGFSERCTTHGVPESGLDLTRAPGITLLHRKAAALDWLTQHLTLAQLRTTTGDLWLLAGEDVLTLLEAAMVAEKED